MQALFVVVIPAALGLVLLVYAATLSQRYNAWTTRLRAVKKSLPSPPTEQMRNLNTRIMTILFRIFGLFLLLPAILVGVAVIRSILGQP